MDDASQSPQPIRLDHYYVPGMSVDFSLNQIRPLLFEADASVRPEVRTQMEANFGGDKLAVQTILNDIRLGGKSFFEQMMHDLNPARLIQEANIPLVAGDSRLLAPDEPKEYLHVYVANIGGESVILTSNVPADEGFVEIWQDMLQDVTPQEPNAQVSSLANPYSGIIAKIQSGEFEQYRVQDEKPITIQISKSGQLSESRAASNTGPAQLEQIVSSQPTTQNSVEALIQNTVPLEPAAYLASTQPSTQQGLESHQVYQQIQIPTTTENPQPSYLYAGLATSLGLAAIIAGVCIKKRLLGKRAPRISSNE